MDYDATLFEKCSNEYTSYMASKEKNEREKEEKWKKLEQMATESSPQRAS